MKDPRVGVLGFCDGNAFFNNKLNNCDNLRLRLHRHPCNLLPPAGRLVLNRIRKLQSKPHSNSTQCSTCFLSHAAHLGNPLPIQTDTLRSLWSEGQLQS